MAATDTTSDDGFTLIEHIPFTTAKVIGSRARIGLVVLASDYTICLLYTSPSPRDKRQSRMPSSA